MGWQCTKKACRLEDNVRRFRMKMSLLTIKTQTFLQQNKREGDRFVRWLHKKGCVVWLPM